MPKPMDLRGRPLRGKPLRGRRLHDPLLGIPTVMASPGAGGGPDSPANAIVMEDGGTPIVTESGDYLVLES